MARKTTICNCCGIRKAGTTGSDPKSAKLNGMCGLCMDEGGWENTHNDWGHEAVAATFKADGYQNLTQEEREEWEAMKLCWICHPELNEATNWKPSTSPAKAQPTEPKAPVFRRTQLNHKEMCTHAQTPKARRDCKNAFWAGVQAMVTEGKLTEDQAWEHCIKSLVKPAEPAKATKWTVAPRGPKGGVINQLKAAKP